MPNSSRFTSRARATGSDHVTRGLLVTATAACAVVAYAPGVSDRLFAQGVSCPIKAWFGAECPCCGMTHGVVALFRGDVLGSLAENAFAWVVVLGLLVSLIVVFAGLQRKIPSFVSSSRVTLLVGIPFAAYSVGRNLV